MFCKDIYIPVPCHHACQATSAFGHQTVYVCMLLSAGRQLTPTVQMEELLYRHPHGILVHYAKQLFEYFRMMVGVLLRTT